MATGIYLVVSVGYDGDKQDRRSSERLRRCHETRRLTECLSRVPPPRDDLQSRWFSQAGRRRTWPRDCAQPSRRLRLCRGRR
jgi:hypothetical protein